MPHLTPDAIGTAQGFSIEIPVQLVPHVVGALAELLEPDAWEKFGSSEPDAAAYAFNAVINSLKEGAGMGPYIGCSMILASGGLPAVGGNYLVPLDYSMIDQGDFGYAMGFSGTMIVPPAYGGMYQVVTSCEFLPNGNAGRVEMGPFVPGVGTLPGVQKANVPASGDSVTLTTVDLVWLEPAQEVGLGVYQMTGDTLQVANCVMHLTWLRGL